MWPEEWHRAVSTEERADEARVVPGPTMPLGDDALGRRGPEATGP